MSEQQPPQDPQQPAGSEAPPDQPAAVVVPPTAPVLPQPPQFAPDWAQQPTAAYGAQQPTAAYGVPPTAPYGAQPPTAPYGAPPTAPYVPPAAIVPVPTTYGQGYASGYRGYPGGYVPPRMPETNSNAIIAFVLSLVGAFMCPIVPSIIALVLAGKAKKAIDSSGGWQVGAGFVTAARIISWVFIVVWGLFVLAYAAFFLLFLILAATTPSSGSTSHLNELSGLVLPWLG